MFLIYCTVLNTWTLSSSFYFLFFVFQAIIHVQQLKDDLQKERDRHDQYMKSSSEKMEKERENVRQACLVETNNLSKQVNYSITF